MATLGGQVGRGWAQEAALLSSSVEVGPLPLDQTHRGWLRERRWALVSH